MTRTTKTLLILSVVLLGAGVVVVSGVVDVQNAVALYIALPAGAILFGLFLISKLLEKEMGLYDEEQRAIVSASSRVGREHPTAGAVRACCEGHATGEAASKSA